MFRVYLTGALAGFRTKQGALLLFVILSVCVGWGLGMHGNSALWCVFCVFQACLRPPPEEGQEQILSLNRVMVRASCVIALLFFASFYVS